MDSKDSGFPSVSPHYVIFDCDIGTDDAWALMMLVKAEKMKNIRILGVTCVAGNTTLKNVTKNTMRVLEYLDRTDIPVFRGCAKPLIPKRPSADDFNMLKNFHGVDGFGDLHHFSPVNEELVHKTHAVTAMYQLVSKYPQQVSLVLTGPLTNFALCLTMYGEDFTDKLKSVHVMGGNIQGVGNSTRSAEFNFYCDPEAAHIALARSSCNIVIMPWETCLDDKISIPMEWRYNTLGKSSNSNTLKLLNSAEMKLYSELSNWMPCDAFLMAAFLFPNKIVQKSSNWHATVELNGDHTRGQMVLNHIQPNKNAPNVQIIEKISRDNFMRSALWSVDNNADHIYDLN